MVDCINLLGPRSLNLAKFIQFGELIGLFLFLFVLSLFLLLLFLLLFLLALLFLLLSQIRPVFKRVLFVKNREAFTMLKVSLYEINHYLLVLDIQVVGFADVFESLCWEFLEELKAFFVLRDFVKIDYLNIQASLLEALVLELEAL